MNLDAEAAWTAAELLAHRDWAHELNGPEIAEIDAAIARARRSGRSLYRLEKEDFPLPTLSGRISTFSEILEHGIGAVMIRGLPIERYELQDQQILFWGVGLHLGTAVSQSSSGERMMSIKALAEVEQGEARGVYTRAALTCHTDLTDVIGMLSLQTAMTGGESTLVSAVAVHDEISRTRPDLLEVLYQPFAYASPQWDPAKVRVEMRTIFSRHRGRFVSNYLREFIDCAGAPPLTDRQSAALDYLDEVCNLPAFSACLPLLPGDMLFFNNFVAYHGRRAFHDAEDPDRHRHLLRLWLSVPNSRELPDSYAVSYRDTRAGVVRGGIHGA